MAPSNWRKEKSHRRDQTPRVDVRDVLLLEMSTLPLRRPHDQRRQWQEECRYPCVRCQRHPLSLGIPLQVPRPFEGRIAEHHGLHFRLYFLLCGGEEHANLWRYQGFPGSYARTSCDTTGGGGALPDELCDWKDSKPRGSVRYRFTCCLMAVPDVALGKRLQLRVPHLCHEDESASVHYCPAKVRLLQHRLRRC